MSVKEKYKAFAGVIVLAGVAAVAVYYSVFCQVTVLGEGTDLSIPPHGHLQYDFNEPSSFGGHATYGAFSSNNGATLYVMSATQFHNFTSGISTPVIYSSGQVTSATLDNGSKGSLATLYATGQYYFVFYNDAYSTTSVSITHAFTVNIC
jgi:hypothetical protein